MVHRLPTPSPGSLHTEDVLAAHVLVGVPRAVPLSLSFGSGALLLDQDEGFWLIHSVPEFPPHEAYSWPPNAHKYGQTLLCVSFPFDQFSKIGEWGQGRRLIPRFPDQNVERSLIFSSPCLPARQLSYTYPSVYAYQLGPVFLQKLPDLGEVVKGHHVLNRPWNSSVPLTSKAGATFQSFAKFGKFGDGEP